MVNIAPGKLWTYLLNAILIAVPASFLVLVWYRHAVSRMMRVVHAGEQAAGSGDVSPAVFSAPFDVLPAWDATAPDRIETRLSSRRRRIAIIYGSAGAVAAAIMTVLFLASMQFDVRPRGAFAAWYVFCWPIIPTGVALLALPQSRNIVFLLGYAGLGAALIFIWAAISAWVLGDAAVRPVQSALGLLNLLGRQFWLPYLIILITGNRRLRSVSPLVIAALLVFSFGSLLVRDLYIAGVDRTPLAPWLLFPGSQTYNLWYLIAVLPIGYVCWLVLQWVARAYQAKRFSDIQLLVDAWWLLVTFQFCTELASDWGWYGLVGMLAFVGYRGVVEIGVRRWRIHETPRRGPGLLLLRVFGFQRRTERLFDTVAQQWRFMGHVMMIAGSDVAMRAIDPGDTVSFIGGRFKNQFIRDEADLRQRLQSMDIEADPDGRFRVAKFFCHEDTWRPTLVSLLQRSQAVLMDLRGFTQANQGVLFELDRVIAHDLLARTLLIVDDHTDAALLSDVVHRQAAALGKPSVASPSMIRLNRQSHRELEALVTRLREIVDNRSASQR